MADYILYWHRSSSSLAPMAVLEEIGVPYDMHEVDFDGGEHDTGEYRRIQPLGLVPALGFDNGRSMFESAAIIQFLGDRHAESGLAPSMESAERPEYLQWMFYLADTIYPSYNRLYHPERYTAYPDQAEGVKDQSLVTVMRQWQVVEDALSGKGPCLLGSRFSTADIYLQMMTTWHPEPRELLSRFPNVRELAWQVVSREPCQRAIGRHTFTTGF